MTKRVCVWHKSSTNKYDRTKQEQPEFCRRVGCDGTEEYAKKKGLSCFYPITEDIEKEKTQTKAKVSSLMLLF